MTTTRATPIGATAPPRRKLPIGIQPFAKLRKENCYHIKSFFRIRSKR